MKSLPIIILTFFLFLVIPASAYTINGDVITYSGPYGTITQNPHTLKYFQNTPEINFTSGFSTVQTLDIGFGFNTEIAKPTAASYYNPHYVNETKSFTCPGFFNYTTTPKVFYCYMNKTIANVTTSDLELYFSHAYEIGFPGNKTATWTLSTLVEWTDVTDLFETINYNYDDKTTWYLIRGVTFNPGETKTIKPVINVKPNTAGKYDIFIKRSSDSFAQAISNGNYVLLDPWWNSSFDSRMNITFTNGTAWGNDLFQFKINIPGLIPSNNCSYIYATDFSGNEKGIGIRNDYNNGTCSLFTIGSNVSLYFNNLTTINANPNNLRDVQYWFGGNLGNGMFDLFNSTGEWLKTPYCSSNTATQFTNFLNLTYAGGTGYQVNMGGYYLKNPLTNLTTTTIITGINNQFEVSSSQPWYEIGIVNASFNNMFSVYSQGTTGLGKKIIESTNFAGFRYNVFNSTTATQGRTYNYILKMLDWNTLDYAGVWDTTSGTPIGNGFNDTNDDLIGGYGNNTQFLWIGNEWSTVQAVGLMYVGTYRENAFNLTSQVWATTYSGIENSTSATLTTLYLNNTNGNITGTYPINVNASAVTNTTGLYVAIWRNGTLIANNTNKAEITEDLGAGFWNYTAKTQGNGTFASSQTTFYANISKASPGLAVYLNGSTSNASYGYGNATSFLANLSSFAASELVYISVFLNGTELANSPNNPSVPNISVLGAGYWNFTAVSNCSVIGNCLNFTNETRSIFVNVSKATPIANITANVSNPVIQGTPVLLTCNYPAGSGFSKFSNDTGTNITIPFTLNTSGLLGQYNYTCQLNGGANYNSRNVTYNMTVALPGGLEIHVYDENNITKTITFDVNVYNSTYSASSTNQTVYNNNQATGDVTVSISATGYGSRRYYVNVPIAGSIILNAYLVNSSIGHNVDVSIQDILELPVPAARIDFLRLFGGNWTTVAQGTTDDSGAFMFFLDPSADYKINIEAEDYAVKNTTLIPTDTSILIFLYRQIAQIPAYFTYWKNITYSCNYNNGTSIVECNFTDTSGHLNQTWLNITSWGPVNSSLICSNYSAASSGTLTCNVSTTGNKTFLANLFMVFHSERSPFLAWSGQFTTGTIVALGILGIILSLILVMTSGLIGFEISPTLGIVFSLVTNVICFLAGFMTLGQSTLTTVVGLCISGGLLIYKSEKHGG